MPTRVGILFTLKFIEQGETRHIYSQNPIKSTAQFGQRQQSYNGPVADDYGHV